MSDPLTPTSAQGARRHVNSANVLWASRCGAVGNVERVGRVRAGERLGQCPDDLGAPLPKFLARHGEHFHSFSWFVDNADIGSFFTSEGKNPPPDWR